jgi:hypothetical protein
VSALERAREAEHTAAAQRRLIAAIGLLCSNAFEAVREVRRHQLTRDYTCKKQPQRAPAMRRPPTFERERQSMSTSALSDWDTHESQARQL